jgi:signal transduction histidine kinase
MFENEIDTVQQKFGVLDLLPVGAFIINEDFQVLLWNKCLAQWAGINKELILGAPIQEYFQKVKNNIFSDRLAQVFNGGPPLYFSSKIHKCIIPCKLPSGRQRDQQFTVTPVQSECENTFHALFIIQDVTDHVKQISKYRSIKEDLLKKESRMKTLLLKIEKSNQELQSFASIASHDLQEPLRKIITFGDRLAARIPDADEQSKDYLDRMQKSALRLKCLVGDLLQLTRIETKTRPFESMDLNNVVQTVIEDLETRLKNSGGVVKINKLPVIEADPAQMYQLFLNLIGNALKFNRKGIPPVVNLDSVKVENDVWEISVEDNGIGIMEEHVDKIFQPFERLHGRSTYEGTGIGLTICNKIVFRHGGEITVKRQSTNGVTFHITLPEKQDSGKA